MKALCRNLALTPIVYCFLPNHYHILIRQDGPQRAGLLPQRLFNSYSKAYNMRYKHSGTLFEGNYKVREITDDAHLLHLCRYIHANPVTHGLLSDVANWPHSDYMQWIDELAGISTDRDFIDSRFASPREYREFVADYIAERTMPEVMSKYLRSWREKM